MQVRRRVVESTRNRSRLRPAPWAHLHDESGGDEEEPTKETEKEQSMVERILESEPRECHAKRMCLGESSMVNCVKYGQYLK